MYAIKRAEGGWVAKSDYFDSYTTDRSRIRVFETLEKAEAARCLSDEFVVIFDLEDTEHD